MTTLTGPSYLTGSTVMETEEPRSAVAPTPSTAVSDDYRPWPVEREELTIRVSDRTRQLPWFGAWWRRAAELFQLPSNWNGFGELQVHATAIKRAAIIVDALRIDGPGPYMTPTHDGSVQLEWHAGDASIEVLVRREGLSEAAVFDGDDESVWPIQTTGDTARLRKAILALFPEADTARLP